MATVLKQAFDAQAFVDGMMAELERSGRTLRESAIARKIEAGEASKAEIVGWCRQHYWGVTYHTRRFLSLQVARMPYELTDGVIENIAEEVLGYQSKSGKSHVELLLEFVEYLGYPRTAVTEAEPNVDAVLSSSWLLTLAYHRPWYEMSLGGNLAIEHQIPAAYSRFVEGFRKCYGFSEQGIEFFTIHIAVDEEHGGEGIVRQIEQFGTTEQIRRDMRAAFFAGAEATRRCWDAFQGIPELK
jgi:pyrroloquinoline quinone (PQQ) biosynthesis protein C